MALSWWTYASHNPPTLIICLGSQSYTRELIEKSGEFTLCLPDAALRTPRFSAEPVPAGRWIRQREFSIALEPSAGVAPPYVRESKVAFECRVAEGAMAGDHRVFIAEVLAVHGDESKVQLFAINGYGRVDTLK